MVNPYIMDWIEAKMVHQREAGDKAKYGYNSSSPKEADISEKKNSGVYLVVFI